MSNYSSWNMCRKKYQKTNFLMSTTPTFLWPNISQRLWKQKIIFRKLLLSRLPSSPAQFSSEKFTQLTILKTSRIFQWELQTYTVSNRQFWKNCAPQFFNMKKKQERKPFHRGWHQIFSPAFRLCRRKASRRCHQGERHYIAGKRDYFGPSFCPFGLPNFWRQNRLLVPGENWDIHYWRRPSN